mgnify:CR=1 FL=1
MDTSSINPASIIDEAIDLSTRLSGTAFPVSIFPAKIQRIIREVHECHNYPTDYIAAAILTAIAVGIGNTHLAQIKQGWIESPILYMALIGRPGANKSHPLSFAMKPFLDYDYRQNQDFEKALAKYDELMSMSRKERAESGGEQFPQEPIRKRFLVSDVTPEGLSLIHAQNKRGLCLWADELSAWFKNFNRYNNGSEEQFWLSVFSAKTTISDRKNAKSSIFIKRPYISVIGTIQKTPGVWRSGRLRHHWPPGCAAAGCRRTALPLHPAGCAPSTAPAKRRTAQSPPASWRTAAASAGRKAVLKTSEA